MLTKFIHRLKIHWNQTTNFFLTEEKIRGLNMKIIQRHLLIINKQLMMPKKLKKL